MASNKFAAFNIYTTAYKHVNNQPISVDVLVPKNLKPGKHPLIVRFHGGFLVSCTALSALLHISNLPNQVTGASLFPMFFASWLLEYAIKHSAIIVCPDYRLLPESSGHDILSDISDFWTWVHHDLQVYLTSSTPTLTDIDVTHILVTGESAGGWCATQSAFSQPAGTIKAVIGAYPQVDVRSDWFEKKFEKPILGQPMFPAELVDQHLSSIIPGRVVSSAFPPERMDLAITIIQQGRFSEFLGKEPILFPIERLSQVESVPPMFAFHGRDDSVIPVEGCEKFVEELRKTHPKTEVKLTIQSGEHGFDGEATIETAWLKEGLDFVTEHWLGPERA
jgi:acetyl esterase/lipase